MKIIFGIIRMFSMNDVKFVAEIQNDINNYSHDNLVQIIIDITDTFHLIENMKIKENELSVLIED